MSILQRETGLNIDRDTAKKMAAETFFLNKRVTIIKIRSYNKMITLSYKGQRSDELKIRENVNVDNVIDMPERELSLVNAGSHKEKLSQSVIDVFVKCFRDDYDTTSKMNKLNFDIYNAQLNGHPTKRLTNSLNLWTAKNKIALEPVLCMIKKGIIGADAVEICGDLLGNIKGYAADLYGSIYDEKESI